MSGFSPLAAFAAQVVANANAAIEQATLDLGAAVAEIQSQINVGDVIVATVLPPQDGVDRIALLNQTVPAQLPPGINPGESIAVQVTGFTNTAVLVQNLGPVDPDNPPQAADVPPPPPPAAAVPAQTAILTTRLPTPAAAQPPAPGTAAAPPPVSSGTSLTAPAPGTAVAPPSAVFVAASVRPPAQSLSGAPAAGAPPAPIPAGEEAPLDLEARIALGRSPSAAPATPASSAGPATPASPAPAQNAAAAANTRAAPAPTPPLPAMPPFMTPARATQSAIPAAAGSTSPPVAPATAPATPEAAFLTRLGVPLSSTTLLAARAVSTAAQTVTEAFAKLETALASVTPDVRTTALRSALSFVGELDLRNVRALPEQIAAFVSNVVDGAESTIAQLVRTWSAAAQNAPETTAEPLAPSLAQPQTPAVATQNGAPAPEQSAQPPGAVPAIPSPALEARAAERMVALDHDVKAAILSLIESPPGGSSPQVLTALRNALVATNALQFNVLASRPADSSTVTIPLPAYFYDGGKPAQIQISRDAPHGKNAMDADNFHVSFVLDTKSLGTVAIDLQTVGRAVSVDVKTQGTAFADRFASTLGDLRSRLELLHYRVATIVSGVAQRGSAAPPVASQTTDGTTQLDMRA